MTTLIQTVLRSSLIISNCLAQATQPSTTPSRSTSQPDDASAQPLEERRKSIQKSLEDKLRVAKQQVRAAPRGPRSGQSPEAEAVRTATKKLDRFRALSADEFARLMAELDNANKEHLKKYASSFGSFRSAATSVTDLLVAAKVVESATVSKGGPSDADLKWMTNASIDVEFTFWTKAGLLRKTVGRIEFIRSDVWIPIMIVIDGKLEWDLVKQFQFLYGHSLEFNGDHWVVN